MAGPSEGQHSARQPPPHRLSAPTNFHKPTRQILPLTPMDKHIWHPGSTGVRCDSPNQPLDIHRVDFPVLHRSDARDGRKQREGERREGNFSTPHQILICSITGMHHNCRLALIFNQSNGPNLERSARAQQRNNRRLTAR